MAVIKSNIAKKYSTKAFFLLFFTKFLIPEPNAAQTEIDNGQITKAVIEIKRYGANKPNKATLRPSGKFRRGL